MYTLLITRDVVFLFIYLCINIKTGASYRLLKHKTNNYYMYTYSNQANNCHVVYESTTIVTTSITRWNHSHYTVMIQCATQSTV